MWYLQTLSLPLLLLSTYITEYYFLVPHLYLYTALLVILNFSASLFCFLKYYYLFLITPYSHPPVVQFFFFHRFLTFSSVCLVTLLCFWGSPISLTLQHDYVRVRHQHKTFLIPEGRHGNEDTIHPTVSDGSFSDHSNPGITHIHFPNSFYIYVN